MLSVMYHEAKCISNLARENTQISMIALVLEDEAKRS